MKSDPFVVTDKTPLKYLLEGDSDREEVVVRALQECQAAIDAGTPIDRSALLEKYSEIREELAACLDGLELMQMSASRSDAKRSDSAAKELLNNVTPSETLGDFRLLRELGKGGMGVVYEAEQLSVGRTVAVKVLPYASMLDKRRVVRFQNEARAAATLEHPHIVPVYFVGNDRGVYYYAMRLIDGQNLAEVANELQGLFNEEGNGKPLSQIVSQLTLASSSSKERKDNPEESDHGIASDTLENADRSGATSIATDHKTHRKGYYRSIAKLGSQIASALDCAHAQGIVHRDIKPANIMLDSMGDAWITDFGLASMESETGMTMTGDLVGTLRYMSPEQTLAKRVAVDHRSDIYSLGATLYELVTLHPIFHGSDRSSLLRQIAFEEPKSPSKLAPDIPRDLETIILRALCKNPDERYASASDFADDLDRFLTQQPIQAQRTPVRRRLVLWARRHPTLTTATTALSAVLLIAAAGLGLLVADHERNLRVQKEQASDVIAATLSEKEKALDAANANLDEALNAIDQFLINLKDAEIPKSNPILNNLMRDAFEIYGKLEASNGLSPQLKRRKLFAIVQARSIPSIVKSDFGDNLLREGKQITDELLRVDPHDLPVFFRKLLLDCWPDGDLGLGDLESQGRTTEILRKLHEQVDHFGSIESMFQSPEAGRADAAVALNRLAERLKWMDRSESLDNEIRFYCDLVKGLLASREASGNQPPSYLASLASQALLRIGDKQKAFTLLELAMDNKQTRPLPVPFASVVLESQGRDAAIEFCEQQLRRNDRTLMKSPVRSRTSHSELQIRLAELLVVAPHLVATVEKLEQELQITHPLIRRNVLLGCLHEKLGNDETALRYFEEAILLKHGKYDAAMYDRAGSLYRAMGDFEKALRCYSADNQGHLAKRRSVTWYEQAMARNDDVAFERSLDEMKQCVTLVPNDNSVFFWNAMNAIRVGDECDHGKFKQGMADVAQLSLDSNPDDWSGRRHVLLAITSLGFPQRAMDLAKSDEEREFVGVADHFAKQRAAADSKEEKAMIHARFNCTMNPRSLGNVDALVWKLATSPQQDLRDYREAAELCRPLIDHMQSRGGTASGWNTVGVVYFRNEQLEDALAALEKSDALDHAAEMRAMNGFVIAMAHWKLGQQSQAKTAYQRAAAWIEGNPAQERETLMFQEEAQQLLGIEPQPASD